MKMLARFGDVPPPRSAALPMDRLLRLAPRMLNNCKKNAAARGIAFALDIEQVRYLIQSSGGHCMVSGIPFDTEFQVGGRRPFAPSIDRGDCKGGYCLENVQLVCVAVNMALHVWGPDVLYRIVEHMAPRVRRARC